MSEYFNNVFMERGQAQVILARNQKRSVEASTHHITLPVRYVHAYKELVLFLISLQHGEETLGIRSATRAVECCVRVCFDPNHIVGDSPETFEFIARSDTESLPGDMNKTHTKNCSHDRHKNVLFTVEGLTCMSRQNALCLPLSKFVVIELAYSDSKVHAAMITFSCASCTSPPQRYEPPFPAHSANLSS
jgi:hypothetical protein